MPAATAKNVKEMAENVRSAKPLGVSPVTDFDRDYRSAARRQSTADAAWYTFLIGPNPISSPESLTRMYFKKGAAVALLAVTAAACNRGQTPPPGAQGMPPTAVELAVAAAKPIEDASEYVATLKSLHSTTIQPQIDGQITQIFVKSGDRVTQGAPLMQIDPRRQQAAVSSQEAERASKEANVNYARQQAAARGRAARRPARSASRSWSRPRRRCSTAEADLKALQAQVQQQEVQLRYYTVAAPTAGIVGDVPVRVGNQVTPHDAADDDRSERDARGVRVGADRARAAS